MNPGEDWCVFECSTVEVKLHRIGDYRVVTVSTERVGMSLQLKRPSNLIIDESMRGFPLLNLASPADWDVMEA